MEYRSVRIQTQALNCQSSAKFVYFFFNQQKPAHWHAWLRHFGWWNTWQARVATAYSNSLSKHLIKHFVSLKDFELFLWLEESAFLFPAMNSRLPHWLLPTHSPRETEVDRGHKTGQTNMDFLGAASGLSCFARAKIETKAVKASAVTHFQIGPTESIALHWSVVSMATKTAGNWPRFLSVPLIRTFSLQQRPLHTKWRIAPRRCWKQGRARDHCRKAKKRTQTSVKMKAKKFDPMIELFDSDITL